MSSSELSCWKCRSPLVERVRERHWRIMHIVYACPRCAVVRAIQGEVTHGW